MADVQAIPDGYQAVTPYLCIDGAADAIDFYTAVFGATERMRMGAPGGKVGHAEIELGGSVIMLSDEAPEMDVRGPAAYGGSPTFVSLYVDDADAVVARAVERGATLLRPVEDKFYGDRTGMILDPWGHKWSIGTHVEDVSPDEMERRAAAQPHP